MPDKKKQSVKAASKSPGASAAEREIGQRIKAKREQFGLNFEQLAALTREYDPEGIAAVTLRRYERSDEGASLPALRELRILCETLDVSADYLIRGDKSEDDTRDQEAWEQLKSVIRQIAQPSPLPGVGKRDPYQAMERQEKLRRARLHNKLKNE